MKSLSNKKWRRINRYMCKGCCKWRYTFKHKRARSGMCTMCERNAVPENQASLFDNQQT